MNYKLIMLGLLIIIFSSGTLASGPTQQYSKIFLTPFYVQSMSGNNDYNYEINVVTPDGISGVKSAIITLDAWINPTRTFYAKMNGVVCNTDHYTVSTSYANAGRAVMTFDCSNAIKPNELNTVTLRSSGNIGSSTAWLDLTYMNKPIQELDVQGTEYSPGENGTVFIGLNSVYPMTDSICDISIFYPNKTFFSQNVMTYLNISSNLFYYDFVVPNTTGVYMVQSQCVLPLTNVTYDVYYASDGTNNLLKNTSPSGYSTWDTGSIKDGDGFVCNPKDFFLSLDDFFGLDTPRYINEVINHSVYLSTDSGSRDIDFKLNYYKFNLATGVYTLLNSTTQLFPLTNAITLYNIDDAVLNTPVSSYETLVVEPCIHSTASFNHNFYFYYGATYPSKFVSDYNAVNSSQGFEYRGSGEVHVIDSFNVLSSQISNVSVDYDLIGPYVWNESDRNLTYYPPAEVNTTAVSVDVWNYTGRYINGVLI